MKLLDLKQISENTTEGVSRNDFSSDEEYLEYLDSRVKSLSDRIEFMQKGLRDLDRENVVLHISRGSKPSKLSFPAGLQDRDYILAQKTEEQYGTDLWIKKTHTHLASRVLKYMEQVSALEKDKEATVNASKKYRKAVTEKRLADMTAAAGQAANALSNIPKMITVGGKKGFDNPYFHVDKKGRYAGPPFLYPELSTPMKQMFVKFNDALKRNGHEGITVLYGGRRGSYINFVGLGARGKFIWRKYQTSAQNGMNWTYINGVKLRSSDVMDDPDKYITKYLRP